MSLISELPFFFFNEHVPIYSCSYLLFPTPPPPTPKKVEFFEKKRSILTQFASDKSQTEMIYDISQLQRDFKCLKVFRRSIVAIRFIAHCSDES